jgi:hypothetical protein
VRISEELRENMTDIKSVLFVLRSEVALCAVISNRMVLVGVSVYTSLFIAITSRTKLVTTEDDLPSWLDTCSEAERADQSFGLFSFRVRNRTAFPRHKR